MSERVGGGSNFSSTIIDAQPIRIISMVAVTHDMCHKTRCNEPGGF